MSDSYSFQISFRVDRIVHTLMVYDSRVEWIKRSSDYPWSNVPPEYSEDEVLPKEALETYARFFKYTPAHLATDANSVVRRSFEFYQREQQK